MNVSRIILISNVFVNGGWQISKAANGDIELREVNRLVVLCNDPSTALLLWTVYDTRKAAGAPHEAIGAFVDNTPAYEFQETRASKAHKLLEGNANEVASALIALARHLVL